MLTGRRLLKLAEAEEKALEGSDGLLACSLTAHISEDHISEDKRLKIQHAILAHHGRYEWGSPVEPQLSEAYVLHFADQFSVKFGPNTKSRPVG